MVCKLWQSYTWPKRFAVASVFCSAALAGCGNTEFSSSSPDGGPADVGQLPRATTASPSTSTSSTLPPPPPPPSSTIAEAPSTGVPGLDDADQLCVAWATLVGTRQSLTVAANFSDLDPVGLARLEVIASPVVQRETLVLAAALLAAGSAAVDGESDRIIDLVIGPLSRRAARAAELLSEAGASAGATALFAQVWLDGLRVRDPEVAVPQLADPGPDLGPLVDAAANEFVGVVTPWASDPSLDVSGIETPATDALIADRCPDLSSLGVGDAV